MWLVFQPERIQNRPSSSPYFGASLSRECFIRLKAWGDDIELGHYISQIASAAMATYGVEGIRLDLKIDVTPTSLNVAMPVGLLVNELMTNAFKYAFNGRGTGVITLECLQQNDERCRVVVADDGV